MKWKMNKCKCLLWFLLVWINAISAGTVQLNIDGIEDLGPDARYEGWLVVADNPVSIGTFTVNASGVLSQQTFTAPDEDVAAATAFIVSIEQFPDPDAGPSDSRYMAGTINADVADLSVGHVAAIGDDLTGATGVFVLSSPTGGKGSSFSNGIWYQNFVSPGLVLPTLPDGWRYEGWVVDTVADEAISTGTFINPDGIDSDGAGPLAGLGVFPPYPGQDFVVEPRDLGESHLAVVSVEPFPDNAPSPFTLKPLLKNIEDHNGNQSMDNNALDSNPNGQVQLMLGDGDPGMPQTVPGLRDSGVLILILLLAMFGWVRHLKS